MEKQLFEKNDQVLQLQRDIEGVKRDYENAKRENEDLKRELKDLRKELREAQSNAGNNMKKKEPNKGPKTVPAPPIITIAMNVIE